jgi:hypothetical protein
MKKLAISQSVLGILTLAIGIAFCSFTGPKSKIKAQKKTTVWVDTLHDFGKVKIGPELVYTFKFKNKSSKPIAIKSAEPGCSCTVSEFTQGPIAKGKTGSVTAKYNTAGRMGFFKKFIKVTFEDGTVQELIITGDVYNPG